MKHRIARALIRISCWMVPGDRRREWLEEWHAELEALEGARARGAAGMPDTMAFAAGALPHALWMRTEGWTVDSLVQDLKFATRVMRRSPVFTAVAALTLALGIGANASIFSLINGLMFRSPVGIHEPDRLVQIARSYDDAPRWDSWSWPALQTIRAESGALEDVAGYQDQSFVIGLGEDTEQVLGQVVTGSYFDVLGITPAAGRLLQPADDVEPGAHSVVVLSHALWVRRFGSDPTVAGTTLHLGSEPYEIVGVAPEGFAGVEAVATPPALWVSTMQTAPFFGQLPFDQWGWSWINAVGRMQPDADIESVVASMEIVTSRLRESWPSLGEIRALVVQGVGLDPEGRAQAKTLSAILMLIVGVVLLLACTNVANLFLARASARRAEVAIRTALGAGRTRLARQLLTESLLVALLATLLAVPVVLGADRFLPLLFPYALAVPVGADANVLLFLLGVGMLAGVLFGLAPVWVSTRAGVSDMLREGVVGSRTRTRLRDALVVAQLALSLGLVAGAALLGRSVLNARAADPGFDPDGLVAIPLDLEGTGRYEEETALLAMEQIQRAVEALPGVHAAAVSNQLPIVGGHSRASASPVGKPDLNYEAEYVVVGPRYFETLGIPILRGRPLGGFRDEAERVVVVNDALARMFWPGEDAIGKEIAGSPDWRVVGVSGDVQMRSLRDAGRPAVYYPAAQEYPPYVTLQFRVEPGAAVSTTAVRQAVATVDPALPIARVVNLTEGLAASMGETRTIGYLVAAFAGLALILAAVGLYGLVSYGAAQRVREMGIRLALGARPDSLARLFLGRGIGIAIAGVAVGLAVAFGVGTALEGLLFGVAPTDFVTLTAAAAALLATATCAAWIPARRASRVDAAVSLRDE